MAQEDAQASGQAADQTAAILGQHFWKVLDSTMAESQQTLAIQVAVSAVHKGKQLKDMAEVIKHEMDQKVPAQGSKNEGVYHCVAGKSFASAISHEARQYIHLKVDTYHVILWKSK